MEFRRVQVKALSCYVAQHRPIIIIIIQLGVFFNGVYEFELKNIFVLIFYDLT